MTSLCPLNSFSAGKVLLSSGGTFLLPRCHLYGGVTKAAVPYEIARGACLRADSRPPLIPFTLVHKTIVPRRVMWYNTLDTL